MRTLRATLVLGVVLSTVAAGVAIAGGDDRHKGHTKKATATLVDGTGKRVGKVTLVQFRGKVTVAGRVTGITPGFHGFHVHAVGKCEGPSFTSAGGHFSAPGQAHGAHAGDLPPLLVNADGSASAAFETDRFTLQQLRDADGSALMVHAGPDNFANIPDRYGEPDAETLNTGDSGARVACGVVR
ncbi:superoxide dismutase family protein [Solirubrobacter sp. CPCC 204708]|uniref:Superoxide dismutase [Cu-Zn] n=1 Tax=Solirubrobacter deserti TaxID=2282478 RepID=A0ABT4RRG2_9ACTN|nr:superoxide dismutase family protein [Solirubrobacter deserti]MBE2314865.1 superoxide dismutase family protein [Solirubrobacter deserti]MDA0141092.1 superoxide dismutase family protein [Solirubrobacter deserti]